MSYWVYFLCKHHFARKHPYGKHILWERFLIKFDILISQGRCINTFIKMGENSTNILNLLQSPLILLKNSDLVQKIWDLKRKFFIGTNFHELCEQIKKLSESLNQLVAENKKFDNNLVIVLNINHGFEEKIVYLAGKKQAKWQLYSDRNNIEISGMPKNILMMIWRVQWSVFVKNLEWGWMQKIFRAVTDSLKQ